MVAYNLPTLGTVLFGTTQNGGANGGGTVFEYTVEGLTLLHSFDDPSVAGDGVTPLAGVCLGTDGNIYGTTMAGGMGRRHRVCGPYESCAAGADHVPVVLLDTDREPSAGNDLR